MSEARQLGQLRLRVALCPAGWPRGFAASDAGSGLAAGCSGRPPCVTRTAVITVIEVDSIRHSKTDLKRPSLQSISSLPLDCHDHRAAVITVIAVTLAFAVAAGSAVTSATAAIAVPAVTVDIIAAAGRCRQERATRTAHAATVSVRRRRNMTNHAMVAAQVRKSWWELLQNSRG